MNRKNVRYSLKKKLLENEKKLFFEMKKEKPFLK